MENNDEIFIKINNLFSPENESFLIGRKIYLLHKLNFLIVINILNTQAIITTYDFTGILGYFLRRLKFTLFLRKRT